MKHSTHLRDMTYIALSAALLCVSAWLCLPFTVPFTLQTFAVITVAGLLGTVRGLAAVGVYLLLGAVGLPVFSGFNSGAGALLGATGGYMAGFFLIALCVGIASDKWNAKALPLAIASVIGIAACYAFGTAWFMYVYARQTGPVGLGSALGMCVIPYIIPDLAKTAAGIILIRRLKPVIRKSS